jgi:predicted ferric reductase
MSPQQDPQEYPESGLSAASVLFLFLAVGLGLLAAVVILPAWLPNLTSSLAGPDPKAYWYLSRGSAFVALSLLWLSMALGLLMTNKMARSWPGVPVSFSLHEFLSLLGVGFSLFHVLVLMGDRYINYNLAQIILPFFSNYQPFWVGLGQLGFYAMLIVTFSFYVRPRIGQKTWRLLHFASFLTYLLALSHGLAAGSDSALPWAQMYYWLSGGSLLFLTVYRMIASLLPQAAPLPANRAV